MKLIKALVIITIFTLMSATELRNKREKAPTAKAVDDFAVVKSNKFEVQGDKDGRNAKAKDDSSKRSYRTVLLGDIGQIDLYYKENGKYALSDFDKYFNAKPGAIVTAVPADIENKYFFDKVALTKDTNFSCGKLKTGFNANEIKYGNFEKIVDAMAAFYKGKVVNDVIVLGDALYTETKRMAINKISKADAKLDAVISALKIELVNRLNCGMIALKTLIEGNNFLKGRTALLWGNHSLDISSRREQKFLAEISKFQTGTKFVTKTELEYRSPILTLNALDQIAYLDIDANYIVCGKQVKSNTLDQCDGYTKGLSSYPEFRNQAVFLDGEEETVIESIFETLGLDSAKKAEILASTNHSVLLATAVIKKYQDKLKELIANLGKEKRIKWKVVRMHQPLFNPEQDMDTKLDDEVMTLFKNAGIHLWFVSHNHSAQFTASLYESDAYKYQAKSMERAGGGARGKEKLEALNSDFKNKVENTRQNTVNNTISTGVDPYYGEGTNRYIIRDGAMDKWATDINRQNWIKEVPLDNIRNINIKHWNDQYILQVLVGYSGRMNDPLFSDRFSDMEVIFGKSGYNVHGFVDVEFHENDALITYYFVEDGKAVQHFQVRVTQTDDEAKTAVEKNFSADFMKELKTKYPKLPGAKRLRMHK